MFPILSSREKVIAFGGRAMSADAPAKYLNSNETELFHKGNVLYNFARARRAIRDLAAVILRTTMRPAPLLPSKAIWT